MSRLVCAALLALLLAQWTALTHAIAHAPLDAGKAVAADAEGPWAHDADSPSCQLIDHFLLGHTTPGAPSVMAGVHPDAMLAAASKCRPVCTGTRQTYEARGPPWA